MRKINEMFHVENDRLIKTSNGQAVPEDEPIFLIRGRDRLALETLRHHREIAALDGCTQYYMDGMDRVIDKFIRFNEEHPERMKQPGVTQGK